MMLYACDSNIVRASDLKNLLDKYTFALLGEYKSADILLVNSIDEYKEKAFFHNKNKCQYRDIIFYDCKEALKTIQDAKPLIMLNQFKPDSILHYLNTKFTPDTFLDDCISKVKDQAYYDKYVLPVLKCGRGKNEKRLLAQAILTDIKNTLLKNNEVLNIETYKSLIQEKKLNAFTEWLKTDQAKEIGLAILNSSSGNYQSFEIKYLMLMAEDNVETKKS